MFEAVRAKELVDELRRLSDALAAIAAQEIEEGRAERARGESPSAAITATRQIANELAETVLVLTATMTRFLIDRMDESTLDGSDRATPN